MLIAERRFEGPGKSRLGRVDGDRVDPAFAFEIDGQEGGLEEAASAQGRRHSVTTTIRKIFTAIPFEFRFCCFVFIRLSALGRNRQAWRIENFHIWVKNPQYKIGGFPAEIKKRVKTQISRKAQRKVG